MRMYQKIRIAIVEDDNSMRDIISNHIKKAIREEDNVEICGFSSAEFFLKAIDSGEIFEILFTDIQLTDMNGVELVREIRTNQPEMNIVFITAYGEYAAESYVLEAFQYILKRDMDYRLPRIVDQLIKKVRTQEKQYRMIGTSLELERIHYRDIIYIYKIKATKYVCYVTTKGEFKERIAIEKLYQELESKEFVLVERSYIVNMKHICKISGDTIYLEQDKQVQISKVRMAEVKRTINEYWREL